MGFFDSVKAKYDVLAADAGRAGKVTAAQARLVVLQNDARRAERELGVAACALIESGELTHPGLAAAAARLAEARQALRDKEDEIATLRGGVPAGRPQAPDEPETAPVAAPVVAEVVDEETGAVSEAEVLDGVAAGPAAEQPQPARKPAAPKKPPPRERPAAKGPATSKTATARKPAAKKRAAGKTPPCDEDAGA